MRKGFLIFVFLFLIVSILLYTIPQFIDFNKYKDRLTKEIETTFEMPIRIDGDINISILPHVRISAKDVKIQAVDKSGTVIGIKNIYIELSLQELLNIEKAQLTKIILSGLSIDLTENSGKDAKYKTFSKVLSGNLFNKIKTVKIQDSVIKYFDEIEEKNETINNINLNITKKDVGQNTYVAQGTIILRKIQSNIKSDITIYDMDKYDAVADINYKNAKTEIFQLSLKISKRQDLFNIIGEVDIKANDIEKLINMAVPSFPNLKITSEQTKFLSSIKYTNNILQMNEFQITNNNTFATGSFSYDLKTKEKDLKIHYKNFEKPKHIQNIADATSLLKQMILQLKNFKLHITAGQFKLNDTKINNLDLKTEIDGEKLTINEFKISSDKINGELLGDLFIENDNLKLNLNISAVTNLKYVQPNLNPIIINSFDGNIIGLPDNLLININSTKTNIGLLSGVIKKQKLQKNKYDINFNSDSINVDNVLTKNIFDFIKSKNQIEIFKDSDLSININSKNFVMQKAAMKSFSMTCNVTGDLISISKLKWDTNDYNISISGNLNNITKDNGIMNNVNYEIKSFDFTNVKIGYLSQIPFLENVLQKESGTIKFTLNGYANDPDITIYGKTLNVTLSATIAKNQKQKREIDLNINHNNSKVFINRLYGEVYNTTQKTLKDNSVSIKTKIINDGKNILFEKAYIATGNQKVNGNISISDSGKISVNMNSNKIDLTKLIKNSNDDYKQNLMIYVLQNTGSDINLNIASLKTYTRTYSDVKLRINKLRPDPSFSISASFGRDANISINGIINGNQYTGNIKLNNAQINEPFFNINNYDIVKGRLSSNINYETFGMNKDEVISNLSGNITVDFTDGRIIGFSGKDIIEGEVYSSPVIITNDVIQIIENGLINGESNFNTITLNANITGGIIENGQIVIDTNDLLINGMLNANIPNKQFSISGTATLSNILQTPVNATYKIKGSGGEVIKEATLESIISKANPTFFEMKRREYINKIQGQNTDQ